MKKDIDRLMKKMKIDAIYAEGQSSKDANLFYLLNGANINARYIKKRGRQAYVIHSAIEREVALKSHHRLVSFNKYDTKKIFEKYKDRTRANAFLTKAILDDLDVRGNVAFYGGSQLGQGYYYLRQLIRFSKRIKIHYDSGKDIISMARETKDKAEVDRIRKIGHAVVRSFNNLLKTVRNMKVEKNVIVKKRNKNLRIGDLRAMLQKELFENGFVNTAGMIVAQGRDAGIPHNAGNDREAVKLGKTIVFDIFPQELGGGYFYDFTRTVCFGSAPEEIKEVYKIVKDSQNYVIDLLAVGKRCRSIEKSLCNFFEKRGHRTFLSTPKTQEGYCHSLGHGLGLNVHENPTFGLLSTNKNRIERGHVFTVEPGLYYPSKGFGIRLEDVIHVDNSGRIVNLTNCARTLVVEM